MGYLMKFKKPPKVTLDEDIAGPYSDLRARRLGLPEGMKPNDDTPQKERRRGRRRLTYKKKEYTRELAKEHAAGR